MYSVHICMSGQCRAILTTPMCCRSPGLHPALWETSRSAVRTHLTITEKLVLVPTLRRPLRPIPFHLFTRSPLHPKGDVHAPSYYHTRAAQNARIWPTISTQNCGQVHVGTPHLCL